MYNCRSLKAEEFIDCTEIDETVAYAAHLCSDRYAVQDILDKASEGKGLTHREAAVIFMNRDKETEARLFSIAEGIKERIYGNRIVIFAPLYLSNHCINSCTYCPYHAQNRDMPRKKLTREEIIAEVTALQDMGHKRLAVESGEDPVNIPIRYIIESLETIYSVKHRNGSIRRANVNIAATTVENYRLLKDAGIGTYILFQETYDRESYRKFHPRGPKSDYAWHTEAHDRAIRGGIDDVGLGVLFGLSDCLKDLTGLLMHAEHLDSTYGTGPHTISIPRICPADGIGSELFENAVPDEIFLKTAALIRVSTPYTGMIVSTRESRAMREKLLGIGISQISGGSCTGVGGYTADKEGSTRQFDISDHRTLDEIVKWLLELGYIPSFCTACYRSGRTGERFMSLAKGGGIGDLCTPNAILTLKEYLDDYSSMGTREAGAKALETAIGSIRDTGMRRKVSEMLQLIGNGTRDIRV